MSFGVKNISVLSITLTAIKTNQHETRNLFFVITLFPPELIFYQFLQKYILNGVEPS